MTNIFVAEKSSDFNAAFHLKPQINKWSGHLGSGTYSGYPAYGLHWFSCEILFLFFVHLVDKLYYFYWIN